MDFAVAEELPFAILVETLPDSPSDAYVGAFDEFSGAGCMDSERSDESFIRLDSLMSKSPSSSRDNWVFEPLAVVM